MRSIGKGAGVGRRWLPALWAGGLALAVGSAQAAPISSRLVVLRKSTGVPMTNVVLWHTAEGATSGAGGSAAVAGCWAFYIEEGNTLCGLNLLSGKVLWNTRLSAPARFAPLAAGNLVLVHDGETLWAYTNTTGRLAWELPMQEVGEKWQLSEATEVTMADGHLFLCTESKILAIDAEKGQPIWANRNAPMAAPATPVAVGGYLYVRSTADADGWARFTVEEGMPATDEDAHGTPATDPQSALRKPAAASVSVSADRRSLTVIQGKTRWTYRSPAPFTIAHVIGETSNLLCVQLIAEAPVAARGS
jgi:outer membrane protein assembly factor BamB